MPTSLIDALQSPAAYGHPVHEVQVLQTHISWVLLTGEFAYKIKKPVSMGFLDFTTLTARRHFCQEELRLNRRLAPQLYLAVVPITGSEQSPRMDGDGEPIEYAVQMRQFPQEALLSRVLERHDLTTTHIDFLAEHVAALHRQVAVAPADSAFGTWESLWQAMNEVFDGLARDSTQGALVHRVHAWSREQLQQHRQALEARRRHGFVRECHGDLHLGNLVLLEDRPVLFDCLEFNDSFRWIDVLSEVAFTIMDLEDRGSPTLAHRFMNAYLEQTGDYADLALLRYYLVYRAAIRAKVACLRLRQANLDAQERCRKESQYASYLNLADQYIARCRPQMYITHGFSGSGKTTLTQPLLEALGAVRLRSDVERKRMFNLAPLEPSKSELSAGIYDSAATERTYARLAEVASLVVRGGYSVIVDATFLRKSQRDLFRDCAAALNVPCVILDIQAPKEELRRRIVQRASAGGDASEADLAVLSHQQASLEPLDEDERRAAVIIDTLNPGHCEEVVHVLACRAGVPGGTYV